MTTPYESIMAAKARNPRPPVAPIPPHVKLRPVEPKGTQPNNAATDHHNNVTMDNAFMIAVGVASVREAESLLESGARSVKRRYDRYCKPDRYGYSSFAMAARKLSAVHPSVVDARIARMEGGSRHAYACVIRRLRGESVPIVSAPNPLMWREADQPPTYVHPFDVFLLADTRNGKAGYKVQGDHATGFRAWASMGADAVPRWRHLSEVAANPEVRGTGRSETVEAARELCEREQHYIEND